MRRNETKLTVDDAITKIAEKYRIEVEYQIRKKAHAIITKEGGRAVERMKAVRAEFGDEAVDASLKSCASDSNVWLSLTEPEGQPSCLEEIEKRAADGTPQCVMPEKRKAERHEPGLLDKLDGANQQEWVATR